MNVNRGGLTGNFRLLRAVCNYARKKEMYSVNMGASYVGG